MEFLYRLIRKFVIIIHKLLNYRLYKEGVILYGIPKLVFREKIILGKNVRINDSVFIHGAGGVFIDENVTLSYGVSIFSTGYDTNDWERNKILKFHVNKKVHIEENVWLCANVTILPGVVIKKDIIVAAGAVVTSDLLEPGFLYAGNPARKVKRLT